MNQITTQQMKTEPRVFFSKIGSEWGIVSNIELTTGDSAIVTKKSGEEKKIWVGEFAQHDRWGYKYYIGNHPCESPKTGRNDDDTPKISFTQIREGAWGIRSDQELTIGDTVTVTKRSGDTRRVIVDELVESGSGEYVYFISDGGKKWISRDERDEIRMRVY